MIPPTKEKGWQLPIDQIEDAVSPHTKAVLLNSPHNPTGAVLSKATLHEIAKICQRFSFLFFSLSIHSSPVFFCVCVCVVEADYLKNKTKK